MEELKALQKPLNEAIDNYKSEDDFPGRIQVIAKAEKVTRQTMLPSDMSMHHLAENLDGTRRLKAIPATESIWLADLANATGTQESLLAHMLRLMSGLGFIKQEDSKFSYTKFFLAYTQEPGAGNWYDECLKSFVHFPDYLTRSGRHLTKPDDPANCPYTSRHRQDGTNAWEIMAQFPECLRQFQLGCAYADAGFPVVGLYGFGQLASPKDADRVTLVDVGGGQDQAIAAILDSYPQIPANSISSKTSPNR